MTDTDVLIIGAGAAGLMCAAAAGKRGRRVMVIDHAAKIAEKIRISGGGRCNFTNIHCAPDRFVSRNPHFATSALRRYTQHDFIALVEKHGIAYHEKTLGQLFCNRSAVDLITMLLDECADAKVAIRYPVRVQTIAQTDDDRFAVQTDQGEITAQSLVIATGGLSIPKIGATGFGYEIAKQFGIPLVETRAGLVPLTFSDDVLRNTKELSGIAVDPTIVSSESGQSFREALLLTHRGISGPAVLQISSYWQEGEPITLNLKPDINMFDWLVAERRRQPRLQIQTFLNELLPKRLVQHIVDTHKFAGRIADLPDAYLQAIARAIQHWQVTPSGSEGYRTAEVTLGGVDTDAVSSKTFEARDVKNLYFIGEVLDVTGHLGGYNFQWAWSSGWCAGQYV